MLKNASAGMGARANSRSSRWAGFRRPDSKPRSEPELTARSSTVVGACRGRNKQRSQDCGLQADCEFGMNVSFHNLTFRSFSIRWAADTT
jgi:hypothetical protein